MGYSEFSVLVQEELKKQEKILSESRKVLRAAPAGRLRCRKRKFKTTFYYRTCEKGVESENNITNNIKLQKQLIRKELSRLASKYAKKNIMALKRLQEDYRDNDIASVLKTVSASYKEAVKACGFEDSRRWAAAQSKQYNYDPKKHIHETISGVKVRSKSEALIANILTENGIPFCYEKPFELPGQEGSIFYPDFTIELPDGRKLLWEHLGLLHDFEYCLHNAEKLQSYQLSGFVIGENLIITQDDVHGGCSSKLIHHIIKTYIKPYFR